MLPNSKPENTRIRSFLLLLFAWMVLLHFVWLPVDPAELWVGGWVGVDAGHHGEDEDEDSGKN